MSTTPVAPPSQDLRKRIFIRLGIAAATLVGVIVAWHAAGPTPPDADQPAVAEPRGKNPSKAAQTTTSIAAADPRSDASRAQPAVQDAKSSEPSAVSATKSGAYSKSEDASSRGAIAGSASAGTESEPHAARPVAPPSDNAPAEKLPKGPYLQVGVFIHPANAAALKAKLEAEGIPVQLATRVQVGPFKNKKEAEAAREKLKAMGLTSLAINQ